MSHPSNFILERFSVNDLAGPSALEVEQHIRACDGCTQFLAQLEAARKARLAAVPAAQFVEQVSARRARVVRLVDHRIARLGAAAMTVLAAAAAILLFVRRPDHGPLGGVTLKGSGVAVHRNRGGDVHALASDETIRGGDALRIVITQSRPTRVAAWVVDVQGRIDRVVEEGSIALPSGESALPGSLVVDSPCIDLELVVLFGVESFQDAERRLKEAIPDGAIPEGTGWGLPGALTRRLRCE